MISRDRTCGFRGAEEQTTAPRQAVRLRRVWTSDSKPPATRDSGPATTTQTPKRPQLLPGSPAPILGLVTGPFKKGRAGK